MTVNVHRIFIWSKIFTLYLISRKKKLISRVNGKVSGEYKYSNSFNIHLYGILPTPLEG